MRIDWHRDHSTGRHRRGRPAKDRPLLTVAAITAVVTVVLSTYMEADRPAADSSPGAQFRVVPDDESDTASNDEILRAFLDPALLEAVPVGPEKVAEPVRVVLSSSRVITSLGESGIPEVALWAYKKAASELAKRDPSCQLPWELLAAIGRVESNHGRFGGAQLRENGYGTRPIRGIPLDGRPHVALIRDSDGGVLDGDTTYDRAVGPMQFIPGTWRSVMADGNADSRRDPNNIYDATEGAGTYLCAGTGSLRDPMRAARAVRRYNNADRYVRVVLELARQYAAGRVTVLPYTPPTPDDRPTSDASPAPEASTRPPTNRPATSAPPATPSAPQGTPTTRQPSQAPAPPTTQPPPAETVPDEPSPTAGPTAGPIVEPSGPADPTQPEQLPTESATPTEPQTAAVGWAPAMREVVLSLLQSWPSDG